MMKYGVAGSLEADKNELTVENAVLLSEDQAAYILHKYEEVSYISGQRAVWSKIGSSVICQKVAVSDSSALAFQSSMPSLDEAFPDGQPHYYTSGKIVTVSSAGAEPVETLWEMYLESYSDNRYYYRIRYSNDGGENWYVYNSRYISYLVPSPGLYFTFNSLEPLAYAAHPYGYVQISAYIPLQDNTDPDGAHSWKTSYANFLPGMYMPFESETEKNAAIALTYEPSVLKAVTETTEATG